MRTKILIAKQYGNPEVLSFHEQELPNLAPNTARIKVKTAGINPIDARRMTGEFKHAAMPQTFGTEFAGIIEEVGPNTANWKVGDEVLGSGGAFTHATVIDVPLVNLIARPAQISWETAGTLAGVSQTAMTILDEIGDVKTLLIHGASGGVGSITIQLAVKRGIKVVATASSKNQTYLQELGATPVVYGDGLIDRIKAIYKGTFDASVDMIGTEEATQASLALVSANGIIATIAGKPSSSARVKPIWVKRNPENLKHVVDGIAAGQFKWNVAKTFNFENAAEAYKEILTGHTKGKIALTFY